jgi:hypothetical protein
MAANISISDNQRRLILTGTGCLVADAMANFCPLVMVGSRFPHIDHTPQPENICGLRLRQSTA